LPVAHDTSTTLGDTDAYAWQPHGVGPQGFDTRHGGVALVAAIPTRGLAEPLARFTIGPPGDIDASTFSSGSFEIENLSSAGERIVRVEYDLSSALLPDLVFDPDGTGGDTVAKPFSPNSGASATGLASDALTAPNGGGFQRLEVNFADFDPGEQFTFSIDVDPTSIQGASAPGPGESGSVSGLELTGTTVTVLFDDTTTLSARTFRLPGSASESKAIAEAGRPPAPTLSLVGVATPSAVTEPNQLVRVTGTPGAEIALLRVEGALFTAGLPGRGFDLDLFEANTAIGIAETSAQLDGSGSVEVAVSLSRTQPEAGLHHFVAVELDEEGGVGDPSDVVVAELTQIAFHKSTLAGTDLNRPTTLQFGPDGRLYVGQQNGLIEIYTIEQNASGDYQVTATETLTAVRSIPNHDDDGSANPSITKRQVTGLLVAGTAAHPVLYVGSSDPRIGGGGSGEETGLDTNSGILTRLTWTGASWESLDLVRGLPRSEENHSINGIQLDPVSNTLYASIGGFTNMGAPSNNFARTSEYALSAAIVAVDLDAIGSTTYDLPTLDDEDHPGPDPHDPFGGNDGKNQAVLVPGGPVQIHSPGWRNAYDLVITEAGQMYTIDNGANGGWGDVPVGEGPEGTCTNDVAEPGQTMPDKLRWIAGPGTYGGHPNPTRANPDNTFNPSDPQSPVAVANPIECDFRSPLEGGALATWDSSTNGLTEYRASNFGGALQGDLLAVSFSNQMRRIKVDVAGSSAVLMEDLFSSVDVLPLDVTAQGDNEVFPGTIWVADLVADSIVIFEPDDRVGACSGADSAALDEDGDGYRNADEIDNATDPCNAADLPPDADGDLESDLNDPDDDNDGLADTEDFFALDPDDGMSTAIPILYSWDNDAEPVGGILGLGFTGLMTNGVGDYRNLFDPAALTAGGAAGVTTVEVTEGTARGSANDQASGFQFGFITPVRPFTVAAKVEAPFAGIVPHGEIVFFWGGATRRTSPSWSSRRRELSLVLK